MPQLFNVVFFVALCLLTFTKQVKAAYPETSLQCYSSLTRPYNKLICPEARNQYCVKEISNLPKDLCGHTQYFGDQFIDNKCIYKKCSEKCIDGSYSFTFGGEEYQRRTYCCKGDYCNSSSKAFNITWWIWIFPCMAILAYCVFNMT